MQNFARNGAVTDGESMSRCEKCNIVLSSVFELSTPSVVSDFVEMHKPPLCFWFVVRFATRGCSRTGQSLMGAESNYRVIDGEMRLMEHSNPNAALVLLLGWAGCSDRYLAKYAKFYEKNCSVLRFTADIQKVRSFSSYRKFALDIYEKILETTTPSSIYCHMFSMNGCSTFCALWNLLDAVADCEELKSKFRGLIFDSCPAYVTPWQAAAAISFALLPPPTYNKTWRETYRLMLAGYFSLNHSMIWLRSQWDKNVYERNYSYFRMMALKDLPKHQLYIYSSTDSICSAESIEQFMAHEQERKAKIGKLFFDDTLHCQHYRLHPEEYEQACVQFVYETQKNDEVSENNGFPE